MVEFMELAITGPISGIFKRSFFFSLKMAEALPQYDINAFARTGPMRGKHGQGQLVQ
jgi:hypothetical protein